jgi:hypothetical protein
LRAFAIVAGAWILVVTACASPGSSSSSREVATSTPDPLACPDGKPALGGLSNFGAYIGTWQEAHVRDPKSATAYRLGAAPGRIEVRCSVDDFVIVEEIHPQNQAPAGLALRLALSEIPDDARKIYDHTHPGCRTLQYASARLAQQLGDKDRDGHVGFSLESDGPTYNAAVVTVIRIDVTEVLGGDSRRC